MQQKQNDKLLPSSLSRTIVKSYLGCNLCLYISFCVLHIASLINLVRLRAYSKIYTDILSALFFLIGAILTKRAQNKLDLPPNLRLNRAVVGLMCLNWVILTLHVAGLIVIFVYMGIINSSPQDHAPDNRFLALIAGIQIVVIIPFVYQVTQHKAMNKSLVEIVTAGKTGPDSDQASFSKADQGEFDPGYGFGDDSEP